MNFNGDMLKIYNTLINSDDKILPNGKLYFLAGPGGMTVMTIICLNWSELSAFSKCLFDRVS